MRRFNKKKEFRKCVYNLLHNDKYVEEFFKYYNIHHKTMDDEIDNWKKLTEFIKVKIEEMKK